MSPRLVVPAYFHPAVCPDRWQWLADHAPLVSLVILNVASGPGTARQDVFRAAVDKLRGAGVRVIGYADTNYGHRTEREILADLGRYQDWYEVDGVCLDRAAAGAGQAGYYAALADRVRAMGAEVVFFNHGTHPAEDYAPQADLLGTFEGPWTAYQRLRVPAWTHRWPPGKFYHVVHSVPLPLLGTAWRLAQGRRVASVYITDRDGPNPYDDLPAGELT
jgi:hypothetical protein